MSLHRYMRHRLGNGKFRNRGDAENMPADMFAGLFSSKPSDDQTWQMGKKLLDAMGVKVSMLKFEKSSPFQ